MTRYRWNLNKIELNRKIRAGLGVSLLILISAAVVSFLSIRQLIDQAAWVDHTFEVIIQLENLISAMKDAETSQRGYLLTNEQTYLTPFREAYPQTISSYNKARRLTADNPHQQQLLDSLNPLIEQRFMQLNTVIREHRQNVLSTGRLATGTRLMGECRRIVAQMKAEENRLLALRREEVSRFAGNTPVILIISSLLAIGIAALSLVFITRDLRNKLENEAHLKNLNQQLQDSNRELTQSRVEVDTRNYLLSGLSDLNNLMREENDLSRLNSKIIRHLCEVMRAQAGAFYTRQADGNYHFTQGYALPPEQAINQVFKPGEGLVGQAALEKRTRLLEDIPAEALQITSGLVAVRPVALLIVPFYYDNQTIAVAELINKDAFLELDLTYIQTLGNTIAVAINRLSLEKQTAQLLRETQNQAEKLETQQEELRQMNEELREQTEELKASEEELKVNQEELQEKNAELEEQFELLRTNNAQLELARVAITQKIDEVEKVSKYKTEFLANMSHELRTPLNSILILAKLLSDNAAGNLDDKQIEFARVIQNSGNDLLKLINEILDLAKIEAGQVKLDWQAVPLKKMDLASPFDQTASKKQITFTARLANDLPPVLYTDEFRLEQILKNLLSNAFKFTPEGGTVEVSVSRAPAGLAFRNPHLQRATQVIAFAVKDSGIGISKEKQAVIFEAFQQADTSTTRRYGGTGLGLTISRDLAALLGGEIQLESQENQGSTFTLYLPEQGEPVRPPAPPASDASPMPGEPERPAPTVRDGKAAESRLAVDSPSKNKTIVIIEDDRAFSKILSDFALAKQFKPWTAYRGEEGLDLIKRYQPAAVLLDINLPDINGWEVLRRIREELGLRDLPVHLMSAYDKEVFGKGLDEQHYLPKPVTLENLDKAFNRIKSRDNRALKRILVVEDDPAETLAVKELLLAHDLSPTMAATGREALECLEKDTFDCLILDMNLPDTGGYEILERVRGNQQWKAIPVIIYSGREFSEEEEFKLRKYANTIIIKSAYSYKRLTEEVQLFLHKVHEKLPQETPRPYQSEKALQGKKVLLADDDMRNIYSLFSVLENKAMRIVVANDGRQALQRLEENPDVDLVLMDVMMPEMDGLECTRRIRSRTEWKALPIIALTAKAMAGDREKCLEAGASDYISKPVDVDKLLSLMTVWMYKR